MGSPALRNLDPGSYPRESNIHGTSNGGCGCSETTLEIGMKDHNVM